MKTLFVIDAYNLIYRMFYAIPEMHTRDGRPVNAIYGVAKFLKSLAEENPQANVVIASDAGESFRAREYSEYKAQRDHMPDNLRSQIEGVFALFSVLHIPVLERDGFEADDIIGSLVHDHERDEYQIIIISSDKDLCQFVRDGKVHIYDAMKRKFMRESDVKEKFGVPPEQIRDYLAIVGDSSDNIPGISGFGPKKAIELLGKFNTLEGIYSALGVETFQLGMHVTYDKEIYDHSEISEKMKQGLLENIHNAFLSKKLATIVTDLEIEYIPASLTGNLFTQPQVIEFFKMYEFRSLLPHDHIDKKKSLHTGRVVIVQDEKGLHEVLLWLQQQESIYLATAKDGKICLGGDNEIYTIDTQRVSALLLLDFLLTCNIEIIGYDLKEDLKYLMHLREKFCVFESPMI